MFNRPIGIDNVEFAVVKRKRDTVRNVGFIEIGVGDDYGVDIYAR